MVDEEVENILLEIRERVRAREVPGTARANSRSGNGAGESSIASQAAVDTSVSEALARIESQLTATSRAWDRLPPLVSNRSGGLAHLELWLKRQIKRITHWFTWEQVNFNAAVHQALQDLLEAQRAAQSGYEQSIEKLRAENEGQRAMLEQNHTLIVSHQEEIEAQREKIAAQQTQLESQRAQSGAQRAQMEAQTNARLSELAAELREHNDRIQEEQRVCFKQLSLEATEAAVLEDRARRKTEALLEEFRRRLEQLEKQS